MARAGLWRIGAYCLLLFALIHAVPVRAQAQSAEEVSALNRQVVQIYQQGRYADALALAEKTAALAERVLGKEHPGTLGRVNNIASLYEA